MLLWQQWGLHADFSSCAWQTHMWRGLACCVTRAAVFFTRRPHPSALQANPAELLLIQHTSQSSAD
ncbi:hypothetical protein MPQ_1973 [Methylovorus sp. MP688]|nr:hypothetical protein MPQ_1973 [Methylovorus sp. MP688]